jgi:hypothetical protein
MKAVILAGGLGIRISEETKGVADNLIGAHQAIEKEFDDLLNTKIFWVLSIFIYPPLNKYLLFFRGVNFDQLNTTWIGAFCFFDTLYPEKIKIGKNVVISFGVKIVCHFEPSLPQKNLGFKNHEKMVIISDGVFVGAGVIIYPGVTIGKNSIISAGISLNKSIPPNSIVHLSSRNLIIKKIKRRYS